MLAAVTTNRIGGETSAFGALDEAAPRRIGAFRIVGLLGRGGMATVYLAEHEVTGERVALKTVESPDAARSWGIRREIHALRRVEHPGVVRIVAEGLDGELPWYAMEVVEGRTLREHTADLETVDRAALSPPLAPAADRGSEPPSAAVPRFRRAGNGSLLRVLRLLRTVCDALAFVHGMGLVHRDLKPENVMVRDDGSPVLVDFGLALQVHGARGRDVLELGERFIGTPAYMAPEQIDGELMDARVDLYALGCMLYEGVTGRVPFLGTVDKVLYQQLHALPEPPSSRVLDVPPALDRLILALLQKRPRDRIGYADDVAAALQGLGAGEDPPARRAAPHLYRSRLAGRDAALAQLEARLQRARLARGGLVLIGGESGVGKTRFALEVGIAAHRRGIAITTGECIAVSVSADDADLRAASLHPFRHLLSSIADHCRERGLAETERILGARGPALAVHEPSISRLPGQEMYPGLVELPAAAARSRLNTCLAAALAAFAEPLALVLVIEDLQWADEAAMSFLQSLDEDYFAASRVLVLGTYRAEETSDAICALRGAPGVARVDLGRLDAAAVQRMVSDMIAVAKPPEQLVRFLFERSEGNPFFVAEYLRLAVQERILVRGDTGAWSVHLGDGKEPSSFESLPLPGELRALVIRRVAALGPGALAAARMAAVLGRESDLGVLAAAMRLDDTAHLDAVEELRARQIVDLDGGRLRFAHDKLREIIHGEIGADERRRLHAAAGGAIEARYASTPELPRLYPELVHHFTTARDHEKAFEYLVKAGQAALDASASGEALGFLRHAVALDDGRAGRGAAPLGQIDRARLESQLGRAALNVGLLPESERRTRAALHRFLGEPIRGRPPAIRALLDLASQLVPQALLLLRPGPRAVVNPIERRRLAGAAEAAARLAEIHYFQQDWIRALPAALRTVNLASRLGGSLELVRAYALLAFASKLVHLSRVGEAYEARARAAAAALGDPRGHGWVEMIMGIAAFSAARFHEARTSLELALTRAEEVQDPRYTELCRMLLAMLEETTGRPDRALSLHEELGAMGRRSGSRLTQIWTLSGQGLCALALDDAPRAIALFEQRRILANDYRDDPMEWITHGIVAEAHAHVGDDALARRTAEATLLRIQRLPVVGFNFYTGFIATGEVLFTLWERATAPEDRRALARRAVRMYRMMGKYSLLYALGRPAALRFRGLVHALSGRPARAHRAFTESLAEAERLVMPIEQALAHYELGRRLAEGDPARRSHLVDARALLAGLGHLRWLNRVEALLSVGPGDDVGSDPIPSPELPRRFH